MKDIMKIEDTMVLLDLVADGYATLTEKGKTAIEMAKTMDKCKKEIEQATIKAVKERLSKYWKETYADYSRVHDNGNVVDYPCLLGEHLVSAVKNGTINKIIEGDEDVLLD